MNDPEVVAVRPEETFRFFLEHVERRKVAQATSEETVYVAGILARFAVTAKSTPMSSPVSLYQVLEKFVLPGLNPDKSEELKDPVVLEVAGSYTLLLNGFFRDQMRQKHNVGWYDSVGRGFYERASDNLAWGEKALLLGRVAAHFALWTIACCKISRMLREKRYLLRLV